MDYTQLEEDLILDHGIWLRPRKTNKGELVIGVGYSGRNVRESSCLSLERAGKLLSDGISAAIGAVFSVVDRTFFDTLPEPTQRALVCIAYAEDLSELDGFVAAVNACDWARAAGEYMETDHAKEKPRRAERLRLALLGMK